MSTPLKVLAVTNMYPSENNPRSGTFVERQVEGLRDLGVEMEVLHFQRVDKGMRSYLGVPGAVRRTVEKCRPDLVHTMYGGVMGGLVVRSVGGAPQVLALCGTDLLGVKAGSLALRLRGAIGVFFSYWALRGVDQIVVKSQNLLRALPEWVDQASVSVIPNGVDLDRFCPLDRMACQKKLGWSGSVFNIVFATLASGSANKRLLLAEQTVRVLERHGVPAKLHVMKSVPHPEVPVWLNAADALLLCSKSEGSPNVVKEALACNRPVVSVDVGDVKERLDGIEGCFLAEPDPEDLVRKLKAVTNGPRVVNARGTMTEFSLEGVARKLLMVYEAAVDGKIRRS